MAVFKRNSSSSDGAHAEMGKTEYSAGVVAQPEMGTDGGLQYRDHKHLHRGLKSRHITMIAIGGAIGTGLIIGTGKALAQSGYERCEQWTGIDLTFTGLRRSSYLTPPLGSWFISSCAASARWRHGFHMLLASLVTQLDSATRLLDSPLDGLTGAST